MYPEIKIIIELKQFAVANVSTSDPSNENMITLTMLAADRDIICKVVTIDVPFIHTLLYVC